MKDCNKRKRILTNVIFWLIFLLCALSEGVRHGWEDMHFSIFMILFLLFASLRPTAGKQREFTDFVLEHRFGKKCELVRWLGLGVLAAGFLFSNLYPDQNLGMRVFLLSLLIFFVHGLWLVLVIVDQKAIWREKWKNESEE